MLFRSDEALRYSSDHHGDGSEKKWVELRDRMSSYLGNMMLQEQGKHSRWPMFWRPTMMTSWWPLSMPGMMVDASSTSMWRPLFELTTATPFLSVPSGIIPDFDKVGHGLSSCLFGGCRGPDCVFLFSFRNLSCKT